VAGELCRVRAREREQSGDRCREEKSHLFHKSSFLFLSWFGWL
jgi:hypothetical protein